MRRNGSRKHHDTIFPSVSGKACIFLHPSFSCKVSHSSRIPNPRPILRDFLYLYPEADENRSIFSLLPVPYSCIIMFCSSLLMIHMTFGKKALWFLGALSVFAALVAGSSIFWFLRNHPHGNGNSAPCGRKRKKSKS